MSETSASGTTPGDGAFLRRSLAHAGGVQHARLLVVTPSAEQADALRTRLTLAGYGVECAANEASALAAVRAHAPDLAIVAASAEGESGGEAAASLVQDLKSASDGAYLPVLLLTGEQEESEKGWTATGTDDVLPWGASNALLRLRVGALLHLKRRHQALADSVLEMEASCATAQQAAARYAAVFRQNREAMLLVGADGQIMEANACACALAGCETGALAGQALTRLCPPELLWASQMTALGTVHSFSDPDASVVTVSGEIVPAEVRSAPVQPAPPPGTEASRGHDNSALFVVTLTDRRPEQARLAHAQRAAAAETAIAFSREISNPLFVIASNIELLRSVLVQEDSGVQAKLGRIAEAGRLLVRAAARATEPSAPQTAGE